MDPNNFVIVDSEHSEDVDSIGKPEADKRPIIHTSNLLHHGPYRYHNYLRDTNDKCLLCHDFPHRERRFEACSPPPPMIAPVGYCESLDRVSTY